MNLNASPADVELRLFKAIVEQTSEAIIFADCDGVIRVWNGGAEALFGFTAAEVLGRSLDVIIPERLQHAHWEGFRLAIESGHTKHRGKVRTTRSLHKLGRRLYVDLSFGLVTDESGSVIGSIAMGRDCTKAHLSLQRSPGSCPSAPMSSSLSRSPHSP